MQAITIAIGKAGINFFAQELVVRKLINTLSALKPPDKTIYIGGFVINDWSLVFKAESITIYLTQGKLHDFTTSFQSFSQQDSGNFSLTLAANNFTAQYNWEEKYNYFTQNTGPRGGHPSWSTPEPKDNTFGFTPAFPVLTLTIPLRFEYNNEWEIVVLPPTAKTPDIKANVPSNSILQYQEGIYRHNVSDASASSVSAIDFSQPVRQLINGIVADIPASGNLGSGIVYDFSLGDCGLKFPNSGGIQMGVKGGASFNGTAFPETDPPTLLPLPTPPADSDTHHLNMYVSNFEVDALNWAYYKAKKLNLTITPQELPDASVLNVSDYTMLEPTLSPYSAFVMNAQIKQNKAPVTSFQTAYVYTEAAMQNLKQQLPDNIHQLILKLPSNAYASKAALDAFLTSATVPAQYFTTIENAGQTTAMVLKQEIDFTLLIQNGQPPDKQPNIKFTNRRTDVLTNLQLGVSSNKTQTMQFGFANVGNTVKYTGTTVPPYQGNTFDGTMFEGFTWKVMGEANYVEVLKAMGKIGVPLPIMKDFQFDFAGAQLSVQEGYVSILANLLYKS